MAPYQRVQFLGYELYSAPTRGPATYVGLQVMKADIEARVKLMSSALNTARLRASSDGDTLKVFMTPEFTFRGARGAYSAWGVQYLVKSLQELVQSKTWEHWLFVFGTILGFAEVTVGGKKRFRLHNFALVQHGGQDDMNAAARVVQKEDLSGRDLLASGGAPQSIHFDECVTLTISDSDKAARRVSAPLPALNGAAESREFLAWNGRDPSVLADQVRGSVFDVCGIRFGLEICFDHANQRIKRARVPTGAKKIQIHLVPSGGMSIQPVGVAAKTGGFIFNVDGGVNEAQSNPLVTLKSVRAESLSPFANADATVAVVNASGRYPVVTPVAMKTIYARAPGSTAPPGVPTGELVVYPPQNVPAASKY